MMVDRLKEDLKNLSLSTKDDFHKQIRTRIGKRAATLLEQGLKNFVLLMPDLISRIYYHWDKNGESLSEKQLMGFVLSYIYHPKDFLPEEGNAFFGYLDDAYLVAIVYEELLLELIQNGIHLRQAELDLLKQVTTLKMDVKKVIPVETKKIEGVVEELLNKKQNKFAEIFEN